MSNRTTRPEVDDPRVLALALARQQLAHNNTFGLPCPAWDGLTRREQDLSLAEARNWLHAALDAGLVASEASRDTNLREAAEKVRAEGPAVIAAWFNYYAPDGSQPSHSERVNGAAEAVAKLIVPEADAHD